MEVTMTTFANRILGAMRLDPRIYEEVEANRGTMPQAVAVVVLASVAGGVGLVDVHAPDPIALITQSAGALLGWVSWALLMYSIGTRFLPEAQTHADAGELLRTLAFAGAPGLLRVFGVIPKVGMGIYAVASVWMLIAMIVAVRQALDYKGTERAVAVCVIGWALSLAIAALIGNVFPRILS
jgi:hypothetical protein